MPQVSEEMIREVVIEYLRQQKNTEKIDILNVENNGNGWLVRGTCPVDLAGHQWAERFEVIIDSKGKVKQSRSALL